MTFWGSFVENFPLAFVDPSGHCPVSGYGECGGGGNQLDEPLPPSWDTLSEEDQHLAHLAYLAYLNDPGYYVQLYSNHTTDPEALTQLACLEIWAEYGENKPLTELLGIDLEAHGIDQLDAIGQELANGEIDTGAYWKQVRGPMLLLGILGMAWSQGGDQPKPHDLRKLTDREVNKFGLHVDKQAWELPGTTSLHVDQTNGWVWYQVERGAPYEFLREVPQLQIK